VFGRKDKKAIASLPPLHQQLVNEQQLVATQAPAEWLALLQSWRHHDELVKKHHLPPRTLDFVLPLLRVLLEDIARDGYLGLRLDLRGPEAAGKATPPQQLQGLPPGVKSIEQHYEYDPWLALEAKLTNKAKLDVWVADVGRVREIHKRSSSGTWKIKTKRKTTQRVRVRLSLPASRPVAAPATGVPNWCRITLEREGDHTVLDGRSKYPIVIPAPHKFFNVVTPQAPGAPTAAQLNNVLLLLGEVFRWAPPARPGSVAS
jgi:hypothetical protein